MNVHHRHPPVASSDGTGNSPDDRAAAPQRADSGASLHFRDVAFRYGTGLLALNDVNLDIPAGGRVGIVGPSGCGKSTLLALVAGLYSPTAGTVEVRTDARREHRLSMVFQKDTVLPWLTVEENVRLYYRFNKGDKHEVDQRVRDLIARTHLQGFESAYPYQLSGGMRRRVAFISSVVAQPETLLLDEPFSSLDEPTRVAIHQEAFDIISRLNTTMVLVTHDLAEAVTLCDTVYILTARPARVVSRHEIDFGGDKRVMLRLRQTDKFLQYYARLWDELSEQIAKSVKQ